MDNIKILDWLLAHRYFTYKEILNYLLSIGYSEHEAKDKIHNILETSQIKRIGTHYVFVTHL